jgi:hypothetical protein
VVFEREFHNLQDEANIREMRESGYKGTSNNVLSIMKEEYAANLK